MYALYKKSKTGFIQLTSLAIKNITVSKAEAKQVPYIFSFLRAALALTAVKNMMQMFMKNVNPEPKSALNK